MWRSHKPITVAQKLLGKIALNLLIAQSNEKLRNTAALSQEDLLAKITDNDKNIAAIDSQLTKVIVDNQKRIYEIRDFQIKKCPKTDPKTLLFLLPLCLCGSFIWIIYFLEVP